MNIEEMEIGQMELEALEESTEILKDRVIELVELKGYLKYDDDTHIMFTNWAEAEYLRNDGLYNSEVVETLVDEIIDTLEGEYYRKNIDGIDTYYKDIRFIK